MGAKSAWLHAPGALTPHMRIGLLGGSFNPAHEGHLYAAQLALTQLKLDRVWLLVSPQNPLKDESGTAPLNERLEGAQALASRDRRIIATNIETMLGTVYTEETLARLKRRFPQTRFVWLMGSDNLIDIPRWKNWRNIFRTVPIAVIARPGTALTARNARAALMFQGARRPADAGFAQCRPPSWTVLDARRNAQSSSRLRAKM
jgi:nicotinate-nucleotide adenylyltransferase